MRETSKFTYEKMLFQNGSLVSSEMGTESNSDAVCSLISAAGNEVPTSQPPHELRKRYAYDGKQEVTALSISRACPA